MSQNKIIIKNAIFLYLRMLVVICLTLLTVRYLYKILGVNDYGLFNLVAGFVVLFSFINNAMRSGTQRYLNVAYAKKKLSLVSQTFSIAFLIHLIVGLIIVFFAETIGLYILNNVLNIDRVKLFEANIVYQFSVLSTFFVILSVPYQALLISQQKMSLFAYIGIIDAVLKFLIVLFLLFFESKLLVLYSILYCLVSMLILIFYYMLMRKDKVVCYNKNKNKKLKKDILNFSSWNILGQLSAIGSNQGNMLVFNIFYGLAINASYAIGQQLNMLLGSLISNLQTAFNPQIIESYHNGNIDRHSKLVLNSSRYSVYLVFLIVIPFVFYSNYILGLWLGGDLPIYIEYLVNSVLLIAVLESLSGPFWMSAHARGNIRNYQMIISLILIFSVPMSYFMIKYFNKIEYALIFNIFLYILAYFYRLKYFFNGVRCEKKDIIIYFKNILMFVFLCIFMFFLKGLDFFIVSDFFEFIRNTIILFFIYFVFLIVLCIPWSELYHIVGKLNFLSNGEKNV